MEGQNSGRVEPLLVSEDEFKGWVSTSKNRLQDLSAMGGGVASAPVAVVSEPNNLMRGTYAMLDARGRQVDYCISGCASGRS